MKIILLQTPSGISSRFLRKVFFFTLTELASIEKEQEAIFNPQLSIHCIFVTPEEIQALNKQWRNKDAVTDVLSFPYEEKENGVFGEIYINLERCMEQAKFLGHSLSDECGVLLIHSLLHLFGYDHIKDDEYKLMRKLETIIRSRCGLPQDAKDTFI